MSTPLIMNTLSNAVAPEIVTWPVFGVSLVRPGARSAMCAGVRPTGSRSSWVFVNVAPELTVATGDGASAVTLTTSVRFASDMTMFTSVAPPRGSATFSRLPGWKADRSKPTV